jgi:hypothetical protein
VRCYSPKFLSLPLVFRRVVGESDSSCDCDALLNWLVVLLSSLLRRMPSALCASYRNRFCSAAPSSSVRYALPSCAPAGSRFANRRFRTEKMSHVSVPPRSLARSVWLWPAAGCTLHLPLALPIMTTLANPVATLVINYMSATYVAGICQHRDAD